MTLTVPPASRALHRASLALTEQRRALDVAWLFNMLVVVVSVGVPWFFRALNLDVSRVLWSLCGYAIVYVLAGAAIDRLRSARTQGIALWVMQGSGLVSLAILWHLLGGLDNPAFLLAFFPPVVACGALLTRGRGLTLAALSVFAVVLVAASESVELRWYLFQIGVPLDWFLALLPGGALPGRAEPFPGFVSGPAFQLVLLVTFTLFVPATAVLSSVLATRVRELLARLDMARRAQGDVEGLFQSVLGADPTPSVLVHADTAQVIHASRSFMNQMLLDPEDLPGRTLFDLLDFSDPQVLRDLLADNAPSNRGQAGELAFCAYRVGNEPRVAQVRAYHIRFEEHEYALVGVLDRNELFYLSRAFEELDEAILVIRGDREVTYFNRAATRLFEGLHFGMDLRLLLPPGETVARSGPAGVEQESVVHLRGEPFLARSVAMRSSSRSEGSAEAPEVLRLLRLRPVGQAGDAATGAS